MRGIFPVAARLLRNPWNSGLLPATVMAFATCGIAIFASEAAPEAPDPREEAERVIEKCRDAYGSTSEDRKPYCLKARVVLVSGNGEKLGGWFTRTWESKEKWREEIKTRNSIMIVVRSEDQTAVLKREAWTARDAAVSLALKGAGPFLPDMKIDEKDEVRCQHSQLSTGRVVTDVIVTPKEMGSEYAWRFDTTTGELLRRQSADGWATAYESRKNEDGLYLAEVMKYDGDRQISHWSATELSLVEVHDETAFSFPKGSSIGRACENDGSYPKVKKRVKPSYPPKARSKGMHGRVSFSILIDKKGNVVDCYAFHHSQEMFEKAGMEAVMGWRFEVPECLFAQAPVGYIVNFNFKMAR